MKKIALTLFALALVAVFELEAIGGHELAAGPAVIYDGLAWGPVFIPDGVALQNTLA